MHSVRDFLTLKFPQTRVARKFLSPLPQKTEQLFVMFFLFQSFLTVHKTRLNNKAVQLPLRPPVDPKPSSLQQPLHLRLAWPCLLQTCRSGAVGTSNIFPGNLPCQSHRFTGHSFLLPTLLWATVLLSFPSVSNSNFFSIFQQHGSHFEHHPQPAAHQGSTRSRLSSFQAPAAQSRTVLCILSFWCINTPLWVQNCSSCYYCCVTSHPQT